MIASGYIHYKMTRKELNQYTSTTFYNKTKDFGPLAYIQTFMFALDFQGWWWWW